MSTGTKSGKILGDGNRFDALLLHQQPFGFRVWLSKPIGLTMQQEIEYKGERIIQNQYHPTHEKRDTLGFDVDRAYVVMDEFDEPALPILQQWFWSPIDAKHAIDLCQWAKKFFNFKKWPTTIAHEYNMLLAYKRNIAQVYIALRETRKILEESDGLEDDADIIKRALGRLHLLQQVVQEGGSHDGRES